MAAPGGGLGLAWRGAWGHRWGRLQNLTSCSRFMPEDLVSFSKGTVSFHPLQCGKKMVLVVYSKVSHRRRQIQQTPNSLINRFLCFSRGLNSF